MLACAHARTGDAAQIAGYLGKGSSFDDALVEFAVRYADQNDADYALFKAAEADGRISAQREDDGSPAVVLVRAVGSGHGAGGDGRREGNQRQTMAAGRATLTSECG